MKTHVRHTKINMNPEERVAFEEKLSELAEGGPNKTRIEFLTELATGYCLAGIHVAEELVGLVERKITSLPTPEKKLTLLYLVDSMMKLSSLQYRSLFQRNMPIVFYGALQSASSFPKPKESLMKLHRTWKERKFFSSSLLDSMVNIPEISPEKPLPLQVFQKPADSLMAMFFREEMREMDLILQKHQPNPHNFLPPFPSPIQSNILNGLISAPLSYKHQEATRIILSNSPKKEVRLQHPPITPQKKEISFISEKVLTWDNIGDSSMKPWGLVARLYDSKLPRCEQCGLRLKDKPSMAIHLDGHFRNAQKLRQKIRIAYSQQWFIALRDWIGNSLRKSGMMIMLKEVVDEKTEKPISVAIAREDQLECPVCGEDFNQFWNSDDEEWYCTETVLKESDDTLYHVHCLEMEEERVVEVINSDFLSLKRILSNLESDDFLQERKRIKV